MKPLHAHLLSQSLLLSLIALVLFPVLAAAQESPTEVATRLQKHYDTIHSLSFDFIQDTRGQLSGRPKKGRGKAFFVKEQTAPGETDLLPGKMRWNYSAPDLQVLVSDGKTFSMYFSALQQMIVTSAQSLKNDMTYAFFTGSGNLLKDFTVLPPDQQQGDTPAGGEELAVIKLIPNSRVSQVAAIHLWVTGDSLIRRIEILDQFDTLTVLNFSNIEVNTLSAQDSALMQHLFTFAPPAGTEIIYQ